MQVLQRTEKFSPCPSPDLCRHVNGNGHMACEEDAIQADTTRGELWKVKK